MGVRKNYRNLTHSERTRFVEALHHVKFWGIVDRFTAVHEEHFNHGIHRNSHFLPWHRELLVRFEAELKKKHADVTIPYWDSSADRSPTHPLWAESFLGQFDSAWGLGRALGSATLPTAQQVETNQTRGTYDTFWPELETSVHNPPHRWVGGLMATTRSPADPVFYMHHCWIDMLWARWQLAHSAAPFVSSGAGLGLTDPLMGWPDRTPESVLDHYALGYSYSADMVSLRSLNYPARYVRHRNFLGELSEVSTDLTRRDSSFVLVPGLADTSGVSLLASNFSNYYLRHQGFRLKLQLLSNDDLFRRDATFHIVPGLADATKLSLRSVNFPNHYIRHRNFLLYLESGSDALFKQDTTFQRTRSLW